MRKGGGGWTRGHRRVQPTELRPTRRHSAPPFLAPGHHHHRCPSPLALVIMSAPSSSVVPLPSLGLHNAGNAHASPLSGVACPIAAPRSQYEAWLQALSESERSLLEAGLIHPPPTMAAVAPSVLAREVIDVDADQSSSSAISISNTTASEPVYQPAIGSRRNPSNFARPVRRRSEAMSDDEAQPPRRPHA